jgi:hypothetical protein
LLSDGKEQRWSIQAAAKEPKKALRGIAREESVQVVKEIAKKREE